MQRKLEPPRKKKKKEKYAIHGNYNGRFKLQHLNSITQFNIS